MLHDSGRQLGACGMSLARRGYDQTAAGHVVPFSLTAKAGCVGRRKAPFIATSATE
jgi:hypothetical protein